MILSVPFIPAPFAVDVLSTPPYMIGPVLLLTDLIAVKPFPENQMQFCCKLRFIDNVFHTNNHDVCESFEIPMNSKNLPHKALTISISKSCKALFLHYI